MPLIRIYNDFEIEYFEYGSGPKLLIAFNGYGRNASEFKSLEPLIGKHFTIVAVNLPFHGNSLCLQKNLLPSFGKRDLKELINVLITKLKYQHCSLLGYSLGGRVALCCAEILNKNIEQVFLFAPDGVKMSPWYLFLSGTALGRSILKQLIQFPSLFFNTAKAIRNLNLLSAKKYQFVYQQMETFEKRENVYHVWVVFRQLLVDFKHLNLNNLSLFCFFGKYDSIVPPKFGKKLYKIFRNSDSINIIDTGHQINIELMGKLIQDRIKIN